MYYFLSFFSDTEAHVHVSKYKMFKRKRMSLNAYQGWDGLQVKLHVCVEPRRKSGRLKRVLATIERLADDRLLGDFGHHVVHQFRVDYPRWIATVIL